MYHVRTVRTASKSRAVQVVFYEHRKLKVATHIGSAKTEEGLAELRRLAAEWIKKETGQLVMFTEEGKLSLENFRYLGIRHSFLHEQVSGIFSRFGFESLGCPLLTDLALARVVEPASLLMSTTLLEELFGIAFPRREFYRQLPTLPQWKERAEELVVALARAEFGFDFSLVFYDVTTLYFEAFESDELRKPGFSKDGKSAQPQVLIGLLVNREGFPVSYEMFPGNTFEGHTMIPAIRRFKTQHGVTTLTVVADAGMLSFENMQALKAEGLSYIVGARLAGIPDARAGEIVSGLGGRDGASFRLETKNGTLVCDFSAKRCAKDRREMEKQIAKAEALVREPGKAKRAKFVANTEKGGPGFRLNHELVTRTESLLGIKGYYTNLEGVDDATVIGRYHDLWHVEHSFRISKSDLEMRPIYHFKKEAIEAHVLICFIALSAAKYMELRTGRSIARILKLFRDVTDVRIVDTITGKEATLRSPISEETREIQSKLGLPY